MENDRIKKIFGKNINKIRTKSGITIDKLSELTGIRKAYLVKIENGSAKRITFSIICNLYTVLNTTFEEMFRESDK